MADSGLVYIWECSGCGEEGLIDSNDLFLGFPHPCSAIKGSFDPIPKIHIKEQKDDKGKDQD